MPKIASGVEVWVSCNQLIHQEGAHQEEGVRFFREEELG
jgi:hypothetical protein